ncbi:MAG: hypothetical protein ACK5M1_06940, partial [Xanthomarina gelatinilytica]
MENYTKELENHSEFKSQTQSQTVSAQRKKEVEGHHAWKKEAYKGMPGTNKSERLDEDGKAIRP